MARMVEREVKRGRATIRTADYIDLVEAEVVEKPYEHGAGRQGLSRRNRTAESREVGRNQVEPVGEGRDLRLPQAAVGNACVQEEKAGPVSSPIVSEHHCDEASCSR